MTARSRTREGKLKRAISLPQLIFYGVGTMVGGGIYALTGKVAGEAAMAAPWAFLVAGAIAFLNVFTFSELSSRMPKSAGEAHYVSEAFGWSWLSILVGWLVILTGVVSAGTLSVATVGFIRDLVDLPQALGIVTLVLAMGLLAAWGTGQSVTAVVCITVVEVAALGYILVVAGDNLADLPDRWPEIMPGLDAAIWAGVLTGGFLAFYAFVGFEDMINMAEEVKDVRRTLPRAMISSVVLVTLLYVAVSLVAVLAVAPDRLAEAATPFAVVLGGTGKAGGMIITLVSILTGINGALVQIIMASRVAYGMARKGRAPRPLGDVHGRTRTPLKATALMTAVVLALALFFPLVGLAKVTSAVILVVFALLNAALWRIHLRGDEAAEQVCVVPRWVPVAGLATCLGLLAFQLWTLAG